MAAEVRNDGVWLQAAGNPPSGATRERTSGGQIVESQEVDNPVPIKDVWSHNVSIQIGVGRNPAVSQRIFNSISFDSRASDSKAAEACARSAHPNRMPEPEHVSKTLVLERGDITLSPVPVGYRPTITAQYAWSQDGNHRLSSERYEVLLALYSSKFPQEQGPGGSFVPFNQDIPAWVIYSSPNSPAIAGCGMWGATSYDAQSGAQIGGSGWTPGP